MLDRIKHSTRSIGVFFTFCVYMPFYGYMDIFETMPVSWGHRGCFLAKTKIRLDCVFSAWVMDTHHVEECPWTILYVCVLVAVSCRPTLLILTLLVQPHMQVSTCLPESFTTVSTLHSQTAASSFPLTPISAFTQTLFN